MSKKKPFATAVEAFIGIRVKLPTGEEFIANKPLFFRDALRWQELLEQYQRGGLYSETLKVIITELETMTEPVDISVFDRLTLGEFIDYVVYSFFSHRRSLPGWMAQLLEEQRAQPTPKPPPPAISPSAPTPT